MARSSYVEPTPLGLVLAALQPYIAPLAKIKQESADPFNVPRI